MRKEEINTMKRHLRLASVALAAGLVLAACGGDDAAQAPAAGGDTVTVAPAQSEGSLLDQVKARGTLKCGVNTGLAGFAAPEGDTYVGFDADYCRAVAAAVLGDPEAIEWIPLSAAARFTALQAGEIDVLIRNTTWTATRDGGEGASFATTTFYDGQGMLVNTDSGFNSVGDMTNTRICVQAGTTTELNLETYFAARGLRYEPVVFEENDQLQEAFYAGTCDGWTSDLSQLAAFRGTWPAEQGGTDSVKILADVMSKEPLGPVTIDNDSKWFDVINWVVIATIQAEEFGVTQGNIAGLLASTDPEAEPSLGRFLGLVPDFDPGLGLDADWAVRVIQAVGNYGEIYERHVGPNTALGVPRGVNSLWTDGGLLYAPPFR
jgi:general L-amino acid transport system substrate-binding protein